MTLWIDVFTRDADTGAMNTVKLKPGKNLFGFEVYRQKLWGAEIMVALNLSILPSLKNGIFWYLKAKTLRE